MWIGRSNGRTAKLACLAAGMLPLLVAPSVPGCGCAGVGCQTGAYVSVDFADDLALLDGPMATACFNDACASTPLPAYVMPGTGTGIAFPDGANAAVTLWAANVDRDRLDVTWSFPAGTVLRAGDRYRVAVTTSSGATIADTEATALAYDEVQTCEASCYVARFR